MPSLRSALSSVFVLAVVTICGVTAWADSVDLQLVSVGSNNAGGVATYPYYFSVNGAAPVAIICDSYDNHVFIGENWQVTVSGLLSGQGLFGNQLLDYKAAGLIFKSILSGATNANIGNFAIWGLFSANAQNSSFFQSSGAFALEQQYLGLAAAAPKSAFNGLALYTPMGAFGDNLPQEYIGYSPVPEPGSLVLLGTGIISIAGIMRRKIKNST